MKRWCQLSDETLVVPGRFTERRLRLLTGEPFETAADFLNEWARRLMHRYEALPVDDAPLVLDALPIELPSRTRSYYKRLLNPLTGVPTTVFFSWAGEILGEWIEEALDESSFVAGNAPHSNDPAYDAISVYYDSHGQLGLRLIQAKVTEARLQANCNLAVSKLKRLEDGEYRAELVNRLALLIDANKLGPEATLNLVFMKGRVRYRITVVHGEDRDTIQILTNFDRDINGHHERRSLRLARPGDWRLLWQHLAAIVYAQLN